MNSLDKYVRAKLDEYFKSDYYTRKLLLGIDDPVYLTADEEDKPVGLLYIEYSPNKVILHITTDFIKNFNSKINSYKYSYDFSALTGYAYVIDKLGDLWVEENRIVCYNLHHKIYYNICNIDCNLGKVTILEDYILNYYFYPVPLNVISALKDATIKVTRFETLDIDNYIHLEELNVCYDKFALNLCTKKSNRDFDYIFGKYNGLLRSKHFKFNQLNYIVVLLDNYNYDNFLFSFENHLKNLDPVIRKMFDKYKTKLYINLVEDFVDREMFRNKVVKLNSKYGLVYDTSSLFLFYRKDKWL